MRNNYIHLMQSDELYSFRGSQGASNFLYESERFTKEKENA